jgi:hypothetical protein
MIREPILGLTMRLSISAFCLVIWATSVTAQIKSEDKKPGDSTYSTGRTVLPDNKGQLQPQGWTGPLDTGSEGAPAESPQGGTPPPMQPAPGGASKSIVDPSPPGR